MMTLAKTPFGYAETIQKRGSRRSERERWRLAVVPSQVTPERLVEQVLPDGPTQGR
jgi:hypothetical protein